MGFVFNLSAFENNIAVISEEGERYYYGDLNYLCGRMETFFEAKDKQLIMIQAKNNIETLTGYLAAVQSGNAAMLVDANLDQALMNILIEVYQPDYLWGPKKGERGAVYASRNYELVRFDWPGEAKLNPSLCVLLSTSGSTGSPKTVRLTSDNIVANARSIAAYLNLDETERPATNLPFHYSYGLSIINSHLLVGAAVLLTGTPVVKKDFWDFFKREAGTSLAGVPYTYELYKKIGFFKMDLPSLRYMTQAGGKLDTGIILEFARFSREKKFEFYVMYGATEATARISYLPPQYNIEKAGSIGRAIPQGRMRLVDESGGTVTKPYTEGELVYEGPNVMMGYAHSRQDLARGDEMFGVLKTGDVSYFDEDGFFYITGRKSRFLKILGKRVGLSEIEEHLRSKGFDCVCGGKDDLLLIACQQGEADGDRRETVEKIKTEIATRYKIPLDLLDVFMINDVPRNSAGKINYQEVFSKKLKGSEEGGG
ncbi:MAG: AMP-binding protein [Peptococcaceae bacterium]|nr:AMP-binding protein [Peptococcaceae bacterium]MDH7526007.1 AMP-binding protein [Peptococcaceae bacterium]